MQQRIFLGARSKSKLQNTSRTKSPTLLEFDYLRLCTLENSSPDAALNAVVRYLRRLAEDAFGALFCQHLLCQNKKERYCLLKQMLFQDFFFLIKSIEIV